MTMPQSHQNQHSHRWHIDPLAPDATAVNVLERDRIWNGYSLADLDAYHAWSRVALASVNEQPRAACLVFEGPDFVSLIPDGDTDGVAAILAAINLPATPFLLFHDHHQAAVQRVYAFPRPAMPMWRMATTPASFIPPTGAQPAIMRLAADDLSALTVLYRDYPPAIFSVVQLRTGFFFGLRHADRIVAAAGTHVWSRRHRIGAIGSVYTDPPFRNRGYSRAATAAVVQALFDAGCEEVILNVAVANLPAQALYTQLGFTFHCRYLEGAAVKKEAPGAQSVPGTASLLDTS
ncbi:MAG: hypothetical protein NVS2B7_30260 [Herpetosiphon sp.]